MNTVILLPLILATSVAAQQYTNYREFGLFQDYRNWDCSNVFVNPAAFFEAHVKDAIRGGWAFYIIRKEARSGKALPASAGCVACHKAVGDYQDSGDVIMPEKGNYPGESFSEEMP